MNPDEIRQRISIARQALKNGQLEVAATTAASVLEVAADNLDALEIRALVEIAQGDDAAAERTLRSAIAHSPGRRWHYADLTRLLLKRGRAEDAERVARAALRVDADNADAHAMLGSILVGREMLVPAAAHFERALALVGRHPQLLTGLGRVRMRQGLLNLARSWLEAAAAADPAALEPAIYLAELEERDGRFETAMQHLDRAERIAALTGTDVVLQRSVLLERMDRIDEAHALLDSVPELSGAARLQRGRLRDRLGRHSEAWDDWVKGKSLLATQAGRSYPAEKIEREAKDLADFFRCGLNLRRAEHRLDVPQPIFILGFPRSGTTLVEQILASHTAIRAGGELPFGGHLRELAASLVGGESNFPGGLVCLADARPDWPEYLRDVYLAEAEELGLTGPGADYFTDKMPLNEMWLPLLRIAFPEAPFVLVRRHPLDVLTSVMAHDMTHGFNCAYRLEDAARHLSLMDSLLVQYRQAGFAVTHELRYESLVADQRGETERLMNAIGLPFESAQLRFHERATASPTPSYAQVREPLNDRSIERWRNYASGLAGIQSQVLEAIRRNGYGV